MNVWFEGEEVKDVPLEPLVGYVGENCVRPVIRDSFPQVGTKFAFQFVNTQPQEHTEAIEIRIETLLFFSDDSMSI
jgi:hypothetical protein